MYQFYLNQVEQSSVVEETDEQVNITSHGPYFTRVDNLKNTALIQAKFKKLKKNTLTSYQH